ncbi:hypothetical protein PAPYR_5881 [Paratrimastix pyriformis]|uniref:Uncharacterized protein n=1 Tax=Paratrimastix pyriformis TaxID=342808 RepID=A0ABQ8UGF8_9EUKA|nr:hypothetical protein PAPYR_5881 [Paratrimastix pyriformis]
MCVGAFQTEAELIRWRTAALHAQEEARWAQRQLNELRARDAAAPPGRTSPASEFDEQTFRRPRVTDLAAHPAERQSPCSSHTEGSERLPRPPDEDVSTAGLRRSESHATHRAQGNRGISAASYEAPSDPLIVIDRGTFYAFLAPMAGHAAGQISVEVTPTSLLIHCPIDLPAPFGPALATTPCPGTGWAKQSWTCRYSFAERVVPSTLEAGPPDRGLVLGRVEKEVAADEPNRLQL